MSDLLEQIGGYLDTGGLFNPELMEHDKVRDLIMDCRSEIERLRAALAEARELLEPLNRIRKRCVLYKHGHLRPLLAGDIAPNSAIDAKLLISHLDRASAWLERNKPS